MNAISEGVDLPKHRLSDNRIVDSPAHYKGKEGLEAIDVIEQFDLNFALGNCIKYILRAGKKDDKLVDLKKAAWYLIREINKEVDNE